MHSNCLKDKVNNNFNKIFLSNLILIDYHLQPIFQNGYNKKIRSYEVLSRVFQNGNIQSITPDIASKFTKELLLFVKNILHDQSIKSSGISINLSQDELTEENSDYICSYFNAAEAKLITIEITEDVLICENKGNLLLNLKRKGFSIALDDFCSEKSVRDLVCDYDFIDTIKFDGVFMQSIKKGKTAIIDALKHLNSFAKSLKKKTVIEHIENKELYSIAKTIEADYLQGYYLGRPLPVHSYIREVE
ncbi:EAL domain-containing protein [Nitrosophilus labii]|uniref:EAL domain-containing protein n=1 Tax=Nitrosophilus labii TaxID=2706014 RepID=UPI001656D661|nr:EAL domain-containing protein [Nitrosophilus labii]